MAIVTGMNDDDLADLHNFLASRECGLTCVAWKDDDGDCYANLHFVESGKQAAFQVARMGDRILLTDYRAARYDDPLEFRNMAGLVAALRRLVRQS